MKRKILAFLLTIIAGFYLGYNYNSGIDSCNDEIKLVDTVIVPFCSRDTCIFVSPPPKLTNSDLDSINKAIDRLILKVRNTTKKIKDGKKNKK